MGWRRQGIGTALYERYHYDHEGQLLTASFIDYLIPTLHELPEDLVVGHIETPSPFTEYGIKGGGEGGRMGAPSAVFKKLVQNERLRFDDLNLPGVIQVTVTLRKVSVGAELNIAQEGLPDVISAGGLLSRLAGVVAKPGKARRARNQSIAHPQSSPRRPRRGLSRRPACKRSTA